MVIWRVLGPCPHYVNFAIAPFLELDKESIKEYQKKLNEWRKAPDGAKGDKPKAKQLRFQDITMEAITKVLGESKRGIFVFVDELRGWASSLSIPEYHQHVSSLQHRITVGNDFFISPQDEQHKPL